MATRIAEKLFNINNIQSGKKIFKTCPKFQELMIINGETNQAIRNLPCSLSLPMIQLPDKLDRAVAKYLRDRVLMRPKDLRIQANSLRNALWSRILLIEKNLAQHIRNRIKRNTVLSPISLLSDEMMKRVESAVDTDIEELIVSHASTIMNMHRTDVEKLVKKEMRESAAPIRYSRHLSELYLVSRLAPNFAGCCQVLYEIRRRCPSFSPANLFDFGSGVGSAAWAANSVWPLGTIRHHQLVDASTHMLAISDYLLKDGAVRQHITALPGVTHRSFLSGGGASGGEQRLYDLVVSCHSLLDVTGGYLNRRAVLDNLWRKTGTFLVLIELGTKAGFGAVLEARDWLLQSTSADDRPARVFAPCPHALACPKSNAACSFTVRYEDLRLTEPIGPMKREQFSYVILHKGDDIADTGGPSDGLDLQNYPRIVSYKTSSPLVHDLCSSDGSVTRYDMHTDDRSLKRFMRHCHPGDLMPVVPISDSDGRDSDGQTQSPERQS